MDGEHTGCELRAAATPADPLPHRPPVQPPAHLPGQLPKLQFLAVAAGPAAYAPGECGGVQVSFPTFLLGVWSGGERDHVMWDPVPVDSSKGQLMPRESVMEYSLVPAPLAPCVGGRRGEGLIQN